ncbi:hypothetical protein HYR99_31755, partial [Candidatus Poribacteria bacterium]|nr:hypothetical protein [Candidatus Poribacteria bacterium]
KSARTVKTILRALCQRGCTVFMTTHILEIAERVCDRIGIINNGKLIAVGTMDELRRREGEAPAEPPNTMADVSLEDIFLELTGSVEQEDMVRFLIDE